MQPRDYVDAVTRAGIEIRPQPSPQDGWRWRMHRETWHGPFATESDAYMSALHTLGDQLAHQFVGEGRADEPPVAIQMPPNEIAHERQADYDAAWTRLFPSGPHAGWYWHGYDHHLVWVFRHQGRWVAYHLRTTELANSPYELLVPGLYEQLVRLDDITNTAAGPL